MANPLHLEILLKGVTAWNEWRKENPQVAPNLSGANLSGLHIEGADLTGADLTGANLTKAHLCGLRTVGKDLIAISLHKPVVIEGMDITWTYLRGANLSEADLTDADLSGAGLDKADFSRAKLDNANFTWASLIETKLISASLRNADFCGAALTKARFENAVLDKASMEGAKLEETDFSAADMTGVNLCQASMVNTIVKDAKLDGCYVFGVSVWNLQGKPASMNGLVITSPDESFITVDDLDVAQFIHMLLTREKLRNVIDTITSKAVLLLGRFTPERKIVLDALADELRKKNYLPIIFDFERAKSRDFTETIKVLAGMSLFVIADISDPSSSPLELQATVPDFEIPFVPIIESGQKPFSMFPDLQKYKWVGKLLEYPSLSVLIKNFEGKILNPALEMNQNILKEKAEGLKKERLS
jgi:uncharacterized protein YjbI with pentapeptide repeats